MAIVFAAIMLFTGATRSGFAQKICGSSDSALLGNLNQYLFEGDQWNASFSSTNQCETITNSTAAPPSGPSMSYSGSAFDDTTTTPADYPDFMYGCFYGACTDNTQLPIQVSALSNYSITSGEKVVEPSGDTNDVAYDIWFNTGPTTPTTQNTTGTEMMIWVQRQGNVGPTNLVGTFTSSGITWNVYEWTNTGNCNCSGTGSQVIDFINAAASSDGPTSGTTFSLSLVPFFEEALALGQIQSSWYLTTIEFGTEIWVGGPGIQVNDFWVNVAPASSGGSGSGTKLTSGDVYTFTPQNATALRMDDSGAKTTTGNPIIVYTANGTGAQNWTASTSGVVPAGYYNLATEGAYCLTASGTASTSAVVLDPCAGTSAQAWEAVASGSNYIFHPANNTANCLDVRGDGTASGTVVQVYTCNGGNNEEWAATLN